MSTIAEPRGTTTRGADDGSPDVVSRPKRQVDPPRIGPLPEPSLVERLRRSWSVYALVPAVGREGESGRVWKRAAWAAVALHIVVFAGIVVVSRLAHARADDTPTQVIAWVPPTVTEEKQVDPTSESSSSPAPGEHSAGSASGGRGSNEGPTPVTNGTPPPTSTTPPIPVPVTPPLMSPIAIPQTALGPNVVTPPPVGPIGIPTAPPSPAPSPGDVDGGGVGDRSGGGIGSSTDQGPGGPDKGPGGRGDNKTPATAPGVQGTGGDLGSKTGPAFPTRDHGIKIIVKVRPTIPQAMIEAGTFGTVRISVTIGANGSILSAEPMDRLANGGTQAAMDALRRCRFEPAVQDGKYVTSSTVVRFDITERGT